MLVQPGLPLSDNQDAGEPGKTQRMHREEHSNCINQLTITYKLAYTLLLAHPLQRMPASLKKPSDSTGTF